MGPRVVRRVARVLGLGRSRTAAGVASGALQERASSLGQQMFLGGPTELFEQFGRLQFIALIRRGLSPGDHLIDVGCGALRAGYWLIHFLDADCYLGIEPNRAMLDAARAELLEPGLEASKRPRFANNDDFDLSVFGVAPRFVLARSIWTHADKAQIERLLDSFASCAAPDGLLLASYLPSLGPLRPDNRSGGWTGRGPTGGEPGVVAHRLSWIAGACRRRGLSARESRTDGFGHQNWLEIRRAT